MPAGAPTTPSRAQPAWLAAALVLAVAVRLAPVGSVFTERGVRYVPDGDPYYHVLRARQLAVEHRMAWRDPGLDAPVGAEVPWPPLFDALLAAPAWTAGGGAPPVSTVDAVAAVLPLLLGIAGVLAGAWLAGELLGWGAGIAAAWVLAVLPAHVLYGVIGRPDQHVLEVLLFTASLALVARALRAGPGAPGVWRAGAWIGALLCAAFWTWLGSAVLVAVLGLFVAAAHVWAEDRERRSRAEKVIGAAFASAAALLAVTLLAFGPEGAMRRISLGGVSGFPVVVTAAGAAWCALLLAGGPRAGALRRAGEVLLASAVVGLAALAVPDVRAAVARGLLAAGRGNSWYASIKEFSPMLFARHATLAEQLGKALTAFGLFPALALAGVVEVRRVWSQAPERRLALLMLATMGGLFTALTAYMTRFAYYGAVPLAVFAAAGLRLVWRAALPHGKARALSLAGGAAALALAPCIPALLPGAMRNPRFDAIERVLGPARAAADGAVLSRWDAGHHVRFFAGLPVVASPFGTEGGEGAMEAMAAFFLAEDSAAAEVLLRARGVRWVVIEDPANAVLDSVALERPRSPPVTVLGDPLRGFRIHCEPSYDRLVASRLYYGAGSATPAGGTALGGFRLVSDAGRRGGPVAARLFEVVPGVTMDVRGARPGPVAARVTLRTALGAFEWTASAVAGADGRAELRVPFATGQNGEVAATEYLVTDGRDVRSIATTEDDIERGARLAVDLGGATRRRPGPLAERGAERTR